MFDIAETTYHQYKYLSTTKTLFINGKKKKNRFTNLKGAGGFNLNVVVIKSIHTKSYYHLDGTVVTYSYNKYTA